MISKENFHKFHLLSSRNHFLSLFYCDFFSVGKWKTSFVWALTLISFVLFCLVDDKKFCLMNDENKNDNKKEKMQKCFNCTKQ